MKLAERMRSSNVMKPDEYTNQVQCVVCRISAVEFDPRTEIDVVHQLEMYRKRPKHWALRSPVITMRR